MTFATWLLRISHSIVGASDGIVEPPRVPFETQVSPLAPCLVSAWYKLIGIPTTANPPNPITEPSGISRTASAKVAKTLLLGISPVFLPNCHTGEGRYPCFRRTSGRTMGPGLPRGSSPCAEGLRDDGILTATARLPCRRSERCWASGISTIPARRLAIWRYAGYPSGARRNCPPSPRLRHQQGCLRGQRSARPRHAR